MSFNIVDLVKDQISDQVLGQMGKALGMESTQASGALTGALPGLLSGILVKASNPDAASSMFDTVQKQDDNLLGNMGNLLGGDQASSIADQGSSMLSSILGSGALGQLAGVVANFSGISRGNSSSLMGMLAPFIIGIIKKKVIDGGMDAGSMASMLSDQKDNVANAMPQGFSDQLQSAGFFDSITAAPSAATAQSTPTATTATATAAAAAAPTNNTASEGSSGGGFMKWLLPLVAVAGIGWFGLNAMNKDSATEAVDALDPTAKIEEGASNAADAVTEGASNAVDAVTEGASSAVDAVKEGASDAVASALSAAQDAMPEGVDLSAISGGLEGVFGSTTDALGGITDVESAKSAIPAIEEATAKLGGINDLITRLPEVAQGPLAAIAGNGAAALQPIIEKITAIPGVGAVIEPAVQPMLDMLSGLGG